MSSDRGLPLWVQNREEVLKNDDRVELRGAKRPSYLITNAQSKGKKYGL